LEASARHDTSRHDKEEEMTEGKGFFESLLDFSFRECVTARNLAFIYGLHLLAGLIAAVVLVVNGFRDSTSQGLLMLVVSVAGFFFWTLYVRIILETLLAIFKIAEAASPPSERR
jgi:hypothetical protein